MKHTITLRQGAVKYLSDMLNATGWAKTTSDIILGGQLLVDIVPTVPEPPVREPKDDPASFKARVLEWSNTPAKPFELTEKQREACRKSLNHFAEQGSIPPTPAAAELLSAFGYSGE